MLPLFAFRSTEANCHWKQRSLAYRELLAIVRKLVGLQLPCELVRSIQDLTWGKAARTSSAQSPYETSVVEQGC